MVSPPPGGSILQKWNNKSTHLLTCHGSASHKMVYWHFFCGICFQELQRSQPRSFCGDGDKTSLNFGRFSLKILFFGACGTKFLCICDGFEVACGLGVVMGTQNPHFWSTLSESKWWEDPGWCAPGHVQLKPSLWIWGGFELGYDLGGAIYVLSTWKFWKLAVWVNPTQPLTGPPCTWSSPFGSLIVHLRWTWGRLWLQCM
jgi:hypothetical protein